MHDFGQYLPFDARMISGVDPLKYHNQFAADWAAVVSETHSEVEGGDWIEYWMRSVVGLSPKVTSLYWMGDQLISHDKYDGLQSAMIAQNNGVFQQNWAFGQWRFLLITVVPISIYIRSD